MILADTAGLRESQDRIEQEGVRRARARAAAADLRLLLLDPTAPNTPEVPADIVVWNKADLVSGRSPGNFWISAKTGEGIDLLIQQLANAAAEKLNLGEAPVLTRARHRAALEEAARAIAACLETAEPELAAEHVRLALRSIGRITGRVDLDELLDVVFRDFCIGK